VAGCLEKEIKMHRLVAEVAAYVCPQLCANPNVCPFLVVPFGLGTISEFDGFNEPREPDANEIELLGHADQKVTQDHYRRKPEKVRPAW
jgi:hypothetical protein